MEPESSNDDDDGLIPAMSNELVTKILWCVAKDHQDETRALRQEIVQMKKTHSDVVQGLKDAQFQEISDITYNYSREMTRLRDRLKHKACGVYGLAAARGKKRVVWGPPPGGDTCFDAMVVTCFGLMLMGMVAFLVAWGILMTGWLWG